MLPSSEMFCKGIKATMDSLILPDLVSSYPKFIGRITSALCEHLSIRSRNEIKTLVDSNDDMSKTIESILTQLESCAALGKDIHEIREDQEKIRCRDQYCSYESLTNENNDLRGILVKLQRLAKESKHDLGDAKAKSIRKQIASCSYRVLQRDYALVKTLEEFQTSIYNMD